MPDIMPDKYCIPVSLYPKSALQFSKCSVVPGLVIKKHEGPLKKQIDDFRSKNTQLLKVSPTHLIHIDAELYLCKLKERLKAEDKEFPEQPLQFIDSFSLAKQAVMSLILAGPVSFSMYGSFSFSRKGNKYSQRGFSNTPHFEVYAPMSSALFREHAAVNIHARQVAKYGKLIDEYYREGIWSIDRYAMALTHFWGAICTQFTDQAVLGITSALECLLSTKNMEITHTLAERVALILKESPSDRLSKYNEVKKIYGYRSKLVHGKAFVKKGRINWDSLCVSPKMMTFPVSIMAQAFHLALAVLTAIISNKEIMTIIKKRKNEDKITSELHSYYTSALFNAS